MSSKDDATPAPVHRLVGPKLAYYGKEITVPGEGICFAASASKARALIFRSAIDAGFKVRYQDIKVRRSPSYDGCMPDDYRNQFFTMEHAENYLRPNAKITGPGEKP
jgi:hypothetical protein